MMKTKGSTSTNPVLLSEQNGTAYLTKQSSQHKGSSKPLSVKQPRRITGQGMTEYIIIVALIALASIVSINLFGNSVRAAFGGLASVLGGGDSAAAAGAATAASGEILNEAAKARKLDGYEK